MRNNIILVLFVFILNFGCSESNHVKMQCLKNYVTTKSEEYPSIAIIKKLKNNDDTICKYRIQIACSIFKNDFNPTAIFFKEENKYYIQFNNPKTDAVVLFDLSSKLGKTMEITFKEDSTEKEFIKNHFSVILEKKLTCNKKDIYEFRVKELYFYEGKWLDVVYFVTQESGVIGSYFSIKDKNGNEIMIKPKGNICKEEIDYSKIEERIVM